MPSHQQEQSHERQQQHQQPSTSDRPTTSGPPPPSHDVDSSKGTTTTSTGDAAGAATSSAPLMTEDYYSGGYIPGFYVPATAAQVDLERGQQLLLERRRANQMFGPSPVLMVESRRARRQWIWLLVIRLLNFAFTVVVLCLVVTLFYRVPTLGYTCEFYQNYTNSSISPFTQLVPGVGLLACELPIIVSSINISILFGFVCFLFLLLLKTFTFYRYAVILVLVQLILVLALLGVWLFTAIYLLIALVGTCVNLICANGLWPHQQLANWLVIFAWLVAGVWVSIRGYLLIKPVTYVCIQAGTTTGSDMDASMISILIILALILCYSLTSPSSSLIDV
jgi:hypothetical protein